jgi:flagellin-like hook-associated protein FlgL
MFSYRVGFCAISDQESRLFEVPRMSTVFGTASSATIGMLEQISRAFTTTQKRVATGVSVFSALDDSARYLLSSRLLTRARQINAINDNISSVLRVLETTDHTIRSMVSLVDQALDITARAQSRSVTGFQGTRSTTDINENTIVSTLAVPGSRFTIIADGGQSFTYTFGAAANSTRWGQIVDALNGANIGIIAEYAPATAPSINNLRFRSISGRDFKFGGDSDQNVIAALGAITSGTGGTLSLANQFVLGAAAPTAANTGFTISYGGAVQSVVNVTAATAVAAGSSITFGSPDNYHTWSTTTATTVASVIAGINGMNVGVVAELANSGAGTTVLRIRNSNGGDLEIVGGAGAFIGPTGTVRFGTGTIQQSAYKAELKADHAFRLMLGVQYDNIIANLALLARNNPVLESHNPLIGRRLSVILGEMNSVMTLEGRDISNPAALGLTQAGSTWTTFNNLLASVQQATSARANLIDLASSIGIHQAVLADRFRINHGFSSDLGELGSDIVAADMAEETAKLSAIQVQQQFATDAFISGTENQKLLFQLIE